MATHETTTRLLDAAYDLVRRRGFNAFSYKDLAAAVGIRTASIHYHFPTKADLGTALMERYTAELDQALSAIEARHAGVIDQLSAFVDLYRKTEQEGAICTCGSFASDRETLPEALQAGVQGYLGRSERWLIDRLEQAQAAGEIQLAVPAPAFAATLLSALQGGLIVSRADTDRRMVTDLVRTTFLEPLKRNG